VVRENDRVLQAAEAMRRGNLDRLGKLMYESHMSLRDDFEVSTPELDAVVDLAATCEGVFGARMTGAGFGGSAITLAAAEKAHAVGACVSAKYLQHTGTATAPLPCRAAPGARVRKV
jgi:galactokinase